MRTFWQKTREGSANDHSLLFVIRWLATGWFDPETSMQRRRQKGDHGDAEGTAGLEKERMVLTERERYCGR